MISQNGKKIIERFVSAAKNLLMQNVTEMLQQWYGIWADGHTIGVEQLPSQDTDIVHTARMLRDRLQHLMAALPDTDTDADKERQAVGQLVAEQAFTQLNRFCALRMCEERDLIMESIRGGYESAGFMAYDSIAQSVGASRYERYRCYLLSVFDELSIELPAVFDRFSPFGLLFPDESTLMKLLELINDSQLSAWFDEQNAVTVNFWKEDETLGWMFQDYNSLEERRKMREASSKPRNSREMAVRNQFFTPEYVVRFLTDNSLGRIWYEMTRGESRIGEEQCRYMIRRPGEPLEERKLKEPTEILSLDPTCGSMHFGLYLYEVYEYIYMDAWDHQPSLLQKYREVHTRESFRREVPKLILENNIYGCEIDPRALQIAALSLWLRAQKTYSQMNLDAAERPLITRSNLVLAEAMPGNKRLLKGLMDEFDKPMQRLLTTIWNKMKYVGEAGLLFKMEKEISDDIEYLRKNWSKVNQNRNVSFYDSEERRAEVMAAKWIYVAKSVEFDNLPNTVIGYYFGNDILKLFKNTNLESRNIIARNGHTLTSATHFRLFYEIPSNSISYKVMYNGSTYSLFYSYYRELCYWGINGKLLASNSNVVLRNQNYHFLQGVGYGKRGEILDAHIFKKDMLFTVEGYAFSNINDSESLALNSLLDSILGQYALNLYTGQHKQTGNVNLLPMPDYAIRQSDIERIVNAIIDIKRKWFSLDETNLEYHGLIAQMHIDTTIDAALNKMQEQLTADYARYEELVKENDDLWMDLADIDRNSEFRQTLNNYKSRRPYEELLSIDGASCQNVIDKKVMAQEIVMELVGMAFGRWNTAYAKGEQAIPEFGDVFDALPFMPVVSQGEAACPAQLDVPTDGILTNNSDSSLCLASHVREVMHYLWADHADDIEYELCQLIGCKSLQAYLASPTGFFDYHFKRYTKSRRKAPIYWLLASEGGTVDYWVYYPKLSKNTLPQLIIRLREQQEQLRTRLNAVLAAHDKTQESQIRAEQEQVEGMMDELNRILAAGYVPNHDDGVPVTAAPLLHLAASRPWRVECEKNMELLEKGDYDWSHLAMSMYPARVTQKAKKDWCMALTHGLEHICENKPKEKKARKKKGEGNEPTQPMLPF